MRFEGSLDMRVRVLAAMTDRLRTGSARLREVERRAAVGDLARQVNHDIKNGLAPIRNVLRHFAQVAEQEPDRARPRPRRGQAGRLPAAGRGQGCVNVGHERALSCGRTV